MIDIIIPQKPLSINQAHYRNKQMTVAYKNYRTAWEIHFAKAKYNIKLSKKDKYIVSFEFGFSNRAADVDNPIKPALDTLQNILGFNDKQVYALSAFKEIVKKGEEYIAISVRKYGEEN